MWEIRVLHEDLRAFRIVKAETKADAELKAEAQMEIWNQRWERQQRAESARLDKTSRALNLQQGKTAALGLSAEAASRIASLENLLKDAVAKGIRFKWDDLKDRTPFMEPAIISAKSRSTPPEPQPGSYSPVLSIVDKLLSSRRIKKEQEAKGEYDIAHSQWREQREIIETENKVAANDARKLGEAREDRKKEYLKKQAAQHAGIDSSVSAFSERKSGAVEYFFSELVSRSDYPEAFPDEAALQYTADTGTLLVDFELPNTSALPTYKDVKYIASRNQLQEVPVSDTWLRKTYDDVLYQIALRTIHELFLHDSLGILQNIVFNGWVRSVDKATGVDAHACIMSIHVGRQEFMAIKLDQVEPKACFRKLKGVASSKLIELLPIRPVMSLSREDDRFVAPYAVAGTIDERTNLASMDWFDFENLIREVFEKEFSKNGGEVKITQASRDGGVDAVAFDPDPIRGGKIVIQAKRYTNIVGVAAVRDLFGTIHNEGATKGILVTTSTYGPDAYEFAKGKPITLLSGSELLYLLEQHGHKSKIDLAAARIEYKETLKSVRS
jgi:restriction system protein